MSGFADRDARARIEGAAAAAIVHALIGLAIVWGLRAPLPRVAESALEVFNVAPPPEPPPPVAIQPPPRRESPDPNTRNSPGREGAAAPPNLRSQATQIVAPPPLIRLPVPPPITAAPVAGAGSDSSQGAAEIPGPGPGAGGIGNGRGSGGYGEGDGGGGGLGRDTPPRHIRGRLSAADYPRAALEMGVGGTVSVSYVVAPSGRVEDCRISRSSGSRALDISTCELIERRFRYAPARDRFGRPVSSIIEEDHSWAARRIDDR